MIVEPGDITPVKPMKCCVPFGLEYAVIGFRNSSICTDR